MTVVFLEFLISGMFTIGSAGCGLCHGILLLKDLTHGLGGCLVGLRQEHLGGPWGVVASISSRGFAGETASWVLDWSYGVEVTTLNSGWSSAGETAS